MERIGVRDLRNDTSKVIRRAKSGERIIVTIDGVPVAQLGPLDDTPRQRSMAELIAMGALIAPRSTRPPRPADPVRVPSRSAATGASTGDGAS